MTRNRLEVSKQHSSPRGDSWCTQTKVRKQRRVNLLLRALMMSDTGLSRSSPLSPVIHTTELKPRSYPAETHSWPLSLSATSSQSRCDHCRLLSCHHTSLNSCETAVSGRAAVLLGHMSPRIYSSWRLPAFAQKSIHGNLCFMAAQQF